tara:strand:- start:48747 stop:51572 length:2826 start_codon:yes stop_codon:yes gene_type:complete
MRLTKIKLAGFKTFVDPTTLQFPSNLTGIIGPNGCGKSNIIDAIRWVMGESSARNLRGDSMEDVIFSGSSARNEVGKAFVELNFDNSTNTLDTKFARYTEIVIKREVSRDGVSNYYLNNTRCRRKDIREVFLGTGLGPRSYAIIEQGMISKLVEAKPDELRTYLEEAAGISKYKEKRRETELRLKHTRDNLNRLNDVMKEITSQLNKLERQAKVANEFREMKEKERNVKLTLLALKWCQLDNEIDQRNSQIRKIEVEREKEQSNLSSQDTKIENLRNQRNEEQSNFDHIQKDFYKIGSDIASCEKDIEHSLESETSRKVALDDLLKKVEDNKIEIESEVEKQRSTDTSIAKLKNDLESRQADLSKLEDEKKDANFAMQNLQNKYNQFVSDQSDTVKQQEVEKTKLEASEKSLGLLSKRLKILESFSIQDNDKKDNKDEILQNATDVQERLSALLVDFQRTDNKADSKFIQNSSSSVKSVIEIFKNLFKGIKLLVRSQKDEIIDIRKKIRDYNLISDDANKQIIELEKKIKSDSSSKVKFDKERIELKQIIDKVEWRLLETQKSENQLNIDISAAESEKKSISMNIVKLQNEGKDMNDRRLVLLSSSASKNLPADKMKLNLQTLLQKKNDKEEELTVSRNTIEKYDSDVLKIEGSKNEIMTSISSIQEKLQQKKINLGEKTAQRDALQENSEIPKDDFNKSIKNTDINQDQGVIEKELEKLQKSISSMGAINLAAIDELEDQQERKKYLDSQYDDLTESIKTLDGAIKKIDIETKSKFKDIFDNINKNLNNYFTKLFGGGKAYLELTDNDLLNTGVTIMARPPGKLIKNISLLSGGEKAGTGIAFVFSIFKTNPAPFCLLDEVDAPLDDANNNRFCDVVKEMSKEVQFIFITHNKLTMELADILSGVTMREAGVSKLVSVNVNDAIKITTNNDESLVSSRPS